MRACEHHFHSHNHLNRASLQPGLLQFQYTVGGLATSWHVGSVWVDQLCNSPASTHMCLQANQRVFAPRNAHMHRHTKREITHSHPPSLSHIRSTHTYTHAHTKCVRSYTQLFCVYSSTKMLTNDCAHAQSPDTMDRKIWATTLAHTQTCPHTHTLTLTRTCLLLFQRKYIQIILQAGKRSSV
jgi:hypothetical protein